MEKVFNDKVYDVNRIKQKLQENYKEKKLFAEVSGRKNFLCSRNIADGIISDQWYGNKRQNVDDEAKCIVETTAKIIKIELKEFLQSNTTGSTTCYASIYDIKIG